RVDHNHHLPPVVLDQVRVDSGVAAFGAFGHGDHGRLHVSKWMNSHTDAQAATTQRPHQGSRRTREVQVGTQPVVSATNSTPETTASTVDWTFWRKIPPRLHRRREQTPLGGGLRFPPAADAMQLFVDQHPEAVTAEQSAQPDQERLTKYSHVTPFPGFTNSSHCAGSPAAANCSSA